MLNYLCADSDAELPQGASLTASTKSASETARQVAETRKETLPHSGDSCERILQVNACSCACCSNFNVAHQPGDVHSAKNEIGTAEQRNSKRSIQASWYDKHPWISVCTSSYKVFCHVCCSARKQNLITFSKHIKLTFVEGGFSNWKKALQRFCEHEKSEMHREAITKVNAKSTTIVIAAQLSTQCEEEMRNHHMMFLKVLENVRYLARQCLALRGNREDNDTFDGNLYQLLLKDAKDCAPLDPWLKKREYISPAIINEIITICGNTVLRQLLQDIYAADNYALIADEATDISHNEHICIAVRYVDSCYDVHEIPLGLIQLPNTLALTLFHVIKDVLVRCSLPIAKCIGQAYDGAANMSGVHNGLQALMKKETNHCLYVHCFAHSLSLCVQEVAKKCELLRNGMEFISELVKLIKLSPKRLNLFETTRKEITFASECESQLSYPALRMRMPIYHDTIN